MNTSIVTITPGASGPGNNGIEGILHIHQCSRTGTSPSDAVQCHIQDTHWWGVVLPTVSFF